MKARSNILCTLIVFCLLLAASTPSVLWSQEHPEHPEHPTEHPADAEPVSLEGLAKAIENYVHEDGSLKGGYFLVYDKKQNKTLTLELDKVHTERLSRIKEDVYFVCADFRDTDGKIYDLDIFMKGKSIDDLVVTEILVHKQNGKARYKWVHDKKNDVWKHE